MKARWLVPGYIWPGDHKAWTAVVALVRPGDIVVINPASGVGSSRSQEWADVVAGLQAAGAAVVGYVPLGYLILLGRGGRPGSVDEAIVECVRYVEWYGVDGVFYDEAPLIDAVGRLTDLRRLHGFARAIPVAGRPHGYRKGVSVWNPGFGPANLMFMRALPASVWCTTETFSTDYLMSAPSREATATRPRLATLIHTLHVGDLDAVRARLEWDGVGYAAITFDTLPNPWDSVPLRP